MKKNKMMRIASVLLIAAMLSTCVISGTFAKYVTSETGSDSARVAKWGVEIVASGETFANTYEKDDNTFTLDANTVVSTEAVVAPGTEGAMANVTITGTPEVAARVEHKVTSITFTDWLVDTDDDSTPDTFYCPLAFTVGTTTVKGVDYVGNMSGLVNAINELVAAKHDVAVGTPLTASGNLTLTWEWEYEVSELYNKYDTYLGDRAAGGYASSVSVTVTTTVTQID